MPAALSRLSPAVQPHPVVEEPGPVDAGMEDSCLCPPVPFQPHLHCCPLETAFLVFPARTAAGPEGERAGERLCLPTRTLERTRVKECPASE